MSALPEYPVSTFHGRTRELEWLASFQTCLYPCLRAMSEFASERLLCDGRAPQRRSTKRSECSQIYTHYNTIAKCRKRLLEIGTDTTRRRQLRQTTTRELCECRYGKVCRLLAVAFLITRSTRKVLEPRYNASHHQHLHMPILPGDLPRRVLPHLCCSGAHAVNAFSSGPKFMPPPPDRCSIAAFPSNSVNDKTSLCCANWSTLVLLNMLAWTYSSNSRSISLNERSFVSGRRNQHHIVYWVEDVDNPWVKDHCKSLQLDPKCKIEEETITDKESGDTCVALNVVNGASILDVGSLTALPDVPVGKFDQATGLNAEIINELEFVPYYFRANRGGRGQMRIVLRRWA